MESNFNVHLSTRYAMLSARKNHAFQSQKLPKFLNLFAMRYATEWYAFRLCSCEMVYCFRWEEGSFLSEGDICVGTGYHK